MKKFDDAQTAFSMAALADDVNDKEQTIIIAKIKTVAAVGGYVLYARIDGHTAVWLRRNGYKVEYLQKHQEYRISWSRPGEASVLPTEGPYR